MHVTIGQFLKLKNTQQLERFEYTILEDISPETVITTTQLKRIYTEALSNQHLGVNYRSTVVAIDSITKGNPTFKKISLALGSIKRRNYGHENLLRYTAKNGL
jgi:hypothetical protein